MKRGYQRLLTFEIILFVLLFLNSFVWNILNGYKTIIFLILTIVILKFIIGIERDRHRYTRDIIFDIIIFLLIFFLLYYLSGLFIGFAKTKDYYNINGILISSNKVNRLLNQGYSKYNAIFSGMRLNTEEYNSIIGTLKGIEYHK